MFLQIKDKSIHYKFVQEKYFSENKPLILFLHEGLGSIAQWKNFPDILCEKLQLSGLLYDRYGHGKSSKLKEKRDMFFLHKEADFIPLILEKLDIKNELIIFGHSDGGTLSLLFAGKYPKKNIISVISEAHHVIIEEISKKGIQEAVKYYKSGMLKSLLEKYHKEKTETMFYGWADTWLSKDIDDWTGLDLLKQITIPVLSIQGKQDQYGSEYQLKAITDNCNGYTETHLLEECGHIPHLHQQDKVLEIIEKFIKKGE